MCLSILAANLVLQSFISAPSSDCSCPVASLGLVSPGSATDSVAPISSRRKKTDDLCSRLHLLTSFVQFSFWIQPHFYFIRVSPPGGYHLGRYAPSTLQLCHCSCCYATVRKQHMLGEGHVPQQGNASVTTMFIYWHPTQ